ncbi:FecR family protein [Chryseosolibacter indicus]|uniref:FecR domain-containing protein n=1 Tax=Chryseosolibacter indicus TaxID=2782351 RepID=A0ABS5VTE5_9BACT|nr:FecR domain-containing protein [Chryseosolibacter indicus]MBT1704694.1 FecR domain-containing protein [Chryseosolibacter indicus]
MEIDKEQLSKFVSYFNGELTDAEKAEIEQWITASEENRVTFSEAKKIWDSATVRLQYPYIDSSKFLIETKSRINNTQSGNKVISFISTHALKIAASVTIIFIISYFTFKSSIKDEIMFASGDKVATLYLPDSSKVWLNVNSKLTYSKDFKKRHVELSGEAFLSVRKDTTAFTVTTKNTITQVLGTSFNLKEQGDTAVTLTVAEGVVKFSDRNVSENERAVVNAHEKAVESTKSGLHKTKNDDPTFAKWRELNNPAFEDEKNNPQKFLSNTYSWKKNQINQSVIEGTLTNHGNLAAYTKIVLNVSYTKPGGTAVNSNIVIYDAVYPGKKLHYKKRLLDVFTDTKAVNITIKSAKATANNSF